ncbi:MAG: hypothetical protein ACYC1Q_07745 [Bacteroidia bacterium]
MEKPEAILVTYPQFLLKRYGGMENFRKQMLYFNEEDSVWFQRCKNKPKYEVPYVYIVIENRIAYRFNCAEWEPGAPEQVQRPDGTLNVITWPRLLLTGPVIEAPEEIEYKGFQGFRYTNQLYF